MSFSDRICPFCAKQDLTVCRDYGTNYYVLCESCRARGPVSQTREGAQSKWNHRATIQEILGNDDDIKLKTLTVSSENTPF